MMEPELINLDSAALGTFRRFLSEAADASEDSREGKTSAQDDGTSDILALSRELRSTNLRMIHRLLENPLNQLISTALPTSAALDEDGRMFLYDARRPDYRGDGLQWDESNGMCVKMIVYNADTKEYRLKNNKNTIGYAVMRRQTFKGASGSPCAGWRKHEYKLVLREKLFRPDQDGSLSVVEAQRLQELPVLVHYFYKRERVRKRKLNASTASTSEVKLEGERKKRRKTSEDGESWSGDVARGGQADGAGGAEREATASASVGEGESACAARLLGTTATAAPASRTLSGVASAFFGVREEKPPPPPPGINSSLASALAYANATHGHSGDGAGGFGGGDMDACYGGSDDGDGDAYYSSSSSCSSSPPGGMLSTTTISLGGQHASQAHIDIDRLLFDDPMDAPKSPQPLSSASFAPPVHSQARILSYAPDVAPWCSSTTMLVVVEGFPEDAPELSFRCVFGSTAAPMRRLHGSAFEVTVPPSSCSGAVSFWCSCVHSGRSVHTNPQPFYYTPTNQGGVLKLNFHSIGAYSAVDRRIVLSKFKHTVRALDLSGNCLTSVTFLEGMEHLDSLILDDNALSSDLKLPVLPSLRTLSLNANRISELDKLLPTLRACLPSLQYLSLLNNEANPYFSRRQHHYYNFRIYVISCLPTLTHLDATSVTIEELRHATAIMGDEDECSADLPHAPLMHLKTEPQADGDEGVSIVGPPMPLSKIAREDAPRRDTDRGTVNIPEGLRMEEKEAHKQHQQGGVPETMLSVLDGLSGTPAHSPSLAMFESLFVRSPRRDFSRADSDLWR